MREERRENSEQVQRLNDAYEQIINECRALEPDIEAAQTEEEAKRVYERMLSMVADGICFTALDHGIVNMVNDADTEDELAESEQLYFDEGFLDDLFNHITAGIKYRQMHARELYLHKKTTFNVEE